VSGSRSEKVHTGSLYCSPTSSQLSAISSNGLQFKVGSPNLVPKTLEDLLRPELKGRKFAVDIRPKDVAGLVPAWGLEKTLFLPVRLPPGNRSGFAAAPE
jgi:hypothetical protein